MEVYGHPFSDATNAVVARMDSFAEESSNEIKVIFEQSSAVAVNSLVQIELLSCVDLLCAICAQRLQITHK
jgi:hypothetical protein